MHYIRHGWKERRNPSAHFDTKEYFVQNPDVKEAGINPLIHYLKVGEHKGRVIPEKPVLRHLEIILTDHCNLNCKGCSNFSPLAKAQYANLRKFKSDIWRLGQLFDDIGMIRFVGGEPLLHPDIASFVNSTRKVFPKSHIDVLTNGILLPKVSEHFFNTCRKTRTSISCTVYPPLKENVSKCHKILNYEGLRLLIENEIEAFYPRVNLRGDTDLYKAFNLCRSIYYCPVLKDGFIYHCSYPVTVHHFNKKFNTNIVADSGIDIYDSKITGQEIIERLDMPIETCKWCVSDEQIIYKISDQEEIVCFPWDISNQNIEEWDVQACRKKCENPSPDHLRKLLKIYNR